MQTLQNVLLLWKWSGIWYLAYLIGWRLVKNLTWVCPKICCILASGLENRGYLDTLNNICFHLKTILKSGQLCFGKKKIPSRTHHIRFCALWLPGARTSSLPWLMEAHRNHKCLLLLLFTSAMLPSFGSHLAELPQA